ncbi:MAG: hypothetical protein H0Z34_06105 [Brevibacillus sp.]|nr:hypothetical protein [Brevibacillus sp.]
MAKSFVRKMAALLSHSLSWDEQGAIASAGRFSPANGLANLPAKRRIRREIAAATASRRQRDVVLPLPLRIVVKRSWPASSLVGHRK